MNIVILISADGEWKAVRSLIENIEIQRSPYGEWFYHVFKGKSNSYKCVVFHGGWGKISAAGSTQYVIDRFNPSLLINIGTCGGFEGYTKRLNILLVVKTVVYDILEMMGDNAEHIEHYSCTLDLSWLSPPYPIEIIPSTIVSGDRDLLVEQIPDLAASYQAIAGDWESGAIAYVANKNSVNLLILRGVSDVVGYAGSEAYGNLGYFEESAKEVFEIIIPSVGAWLDCAEIK